MADDEELSNAGHIGDDPEPVDPNPSDDDGNEADDRVQGEGGDDAPLDPENTKPDDDDQDSVLDALANGTMDDLDPEGNPKPKDKVKQDADPELKTEDPPAESEEEKAAKEAAAKAKATEDDLTPEEKAELAKTTKGTRKIAQRLFKERKELRGQIETKTKEVEAKIAELEALKPTKTFAEQMFKDLHDAGLVVKQADGKFSYKGWINLVNTEKALRNKKPAEIAAHYRKMADQIDPSSRPVRLAQDLADKVTGEELSRDEAETIQRMRDDKANPPPAKTDDEDPEEHEQETARVHQERLAAHQQAQNQGLAEIQTVFKGCESKYGAEWPALKQQVLDALKPLVKDTSPKLWKQLAEQQIRLIIAERKTPLRKPTTTPPVNVPKIKTNRVPTEAEEAELLAAGKLH